MRMYDKRKRERQKGRRRHRLVGMLVLCLLLNYLGLHSIPAYAASEDAACFDVGGGVSAVLKDGTLTLSGQGGTDDYSAQTAPFSAHAGEIHTLVIEDGVTYLGAYLFYGLGGLGGELTLPGSITGFGDYVFSGAQPDSAPKFTIIRNQFTSAEITERIPVEAEISVEDAGGENMVSQEEMSEDVGTEPVQETDPVQETQPESVPPEDTTRTRSITQQEMTSPETLFAAGQDGFVICSNENGSFAGAAKSVGYQVSDSSATLILDNEVEVELPVIEGQICLPECPEKIIAGHGQDDFYKYEFAGWSRTPSDDTGNVLASGEYISADGSSQILLYSVWNKITLDSQDSTTTEMPVLDPEGLDVGAGEYTVYVDQKTGNDDTNKGTKDSPFMSLTKAAKELEKVSPNGTVETNRIILLNHYVMDSEKEGDVGKKKGEEAGEIFGGTVIAACISGIDPNISLTGGRIIRENGKLSDVTIEVSGNIKMENLTLPQNHHIFGNGNDITFGKNITSVNIYLYGSERSIGKIDKVGKIKVESGGFNRIVGYIRSYSGTTDANGQEANITISGGTVNTIVAGSASGGIKNANVNISIEGGTVKTIVGGNQGFSTNASPYSGSTTIKVSGGEVEDIYGGGTGRDASIPTYLGTLDIDVTGGKIKNIYGAGSAAYVISEDGQQSKVNIAASGGEIGNIFAAGKGNESVIKNNESNTLGTLPEKFGSLTGTADITIGGDAKVTGSIYASGEGDTSQIPNYEGDGLKKNAYLNGSVVITINGGTVKKNIYGGGKGSGNEGYEECARVEKGSKVKVIVNGGTVEGSVYGGGEIGKIGGDTEVTVKDGTVSGAVFGGGKNGGVEGSTKVGIEGGTVNGNVYGGGENAAVQGKTEVNVTNGTIDNSVYGGALGTAGQNLVLGGATVNMTGGWVKKNLYGGSEKSDDGAEQENASDDLIFVNLTGGTVTKNVFGGGYMGKVYGSTHVHIGKDAPDKCLYYGTHPEQKPSLTAASLQIGGSAYAGGDFGGGKSYDEITITGTSHVYVDGVGYNTGGDEKTAPNMTISGGVFGSGASCDAGSTRLVTLDHYGVLDKTSATTNVTRTLEAIQRADRVLLINSHVRLEGKSDIANSNTTALYSLNRIGDHKNPDTGELGKGLVLQGGSTVILDAEAIGLGRFASVDSNGKTVELSKIRDTPNKICFDAGTVFRVAVEEKGSLEYGEVSGYSYMEAGDTAEVFAYARVKDSAVNHDGGFVDPTEESPNTEIDYINVSDKYRYWQMKKAGAVSERQAVVTAQQLKQGDTGYIDGIYSVAEGTIELPHSTNETTYTITNVELVDTSGLTLVEAALNGMDGGSWITSKENQVSGSNVELAEEKKSIVDNPLSNFGLYMKTGTGFQTEGGTNGKVVSQKSMTSNDPNTIISTETNKTEIDTVPQVKFYLTYSNEGITVSKNVGAVVIQLEGTDSKGIKTIVNMKVEIITKALALSDQSIDLYATQSGSYTGKLTIPAGVSRSLSLQKVVSSPSDNFISYDSPTFSEEQFGISMRPVSSSGWTGVTSEPYDLKSFLDGAKKDIGTTDSRYEAVIEFILKNSSGFKAKDTPDTVILTLTDGDNQETKVTLNIHWSPSVVSEVKLAAGRQYGEITGGEGKPVISPKSMVTTQYKLGTTTSFNNLWLELKKSNPDTVTAFPVDTQLTLLAGSDFYIYKVTGTEKNNRVKLSDFQQMWGTSAPTGNVAENTGFNIIVDFSGVEAKLEAGDYGLRLRTETSADTQDDLFVVNNSAPTVSITDMPSSTASRDEFSFTLSASANQDTRFISGGIAVLISEDGKTFPPGTVVHYTDGGNTYSVYPRGGNIYLPMVSGGRTFTMNTLNTAGLPEGTKAFKAVLLPSGISAGAHWESYESSPVSLQVTANPETALSITRQGMAARIVHAGDVLEFNAEYILSGSSDIEVREQKKTAGTYADIESWDVAGNTGLTGETSNIKVTVPNGVGPGTYRIVFKLGEHEEPYHIIVE